jgi:hypothetical protein
LRSRKWWAYHRQLNTGVRPNKERNMKYFTKELWLRLQDDNDKTILKEIKRKTLEYRKSFEKLKPFLPHQTFKYFQSHDSHGHYNLDIKINYKGKLNKQGNEVHFLSEKGNKINIEIKVLCPSKSLLLISYKNVNQYTLDYPSEKPLHFDGKNGYDSWAYEEITRKSGKLIHEILFHSGAVFYIECQSISLKRLPFKRKQA